MRARAADRDRANLLEQARKEAKAAQKQREARRKAAFGRDSLFGTSYARDGAVESEAPVAPAELAIDALAGLPSGDARTTWRTVGQLAPRGLANAGQTCYASCVVQVLLRVPAVAVWLHAHANQCDGLSGDGSEARCGACALWATRLQLGSKAMPELVRHRGAIDTRFDERGQHDRG